MAIIEVSHVTKEFKLGALHGVKQTVQNSLARLRGEPIQERPLFKALEDVDFKVEEGEVLGIIGHNGAGKSTLLKLLANITSPTHGSVNVKGKVAPLIEVGAGLVGDLTGRENIFLNGAILGIPKTEIKNKFDDIVAFAELEEFIDTPIKRYSSGMAVRLGFAIATSVDSDILIVDEVLAVGDLAFQRKCFDRMEDIIKRQGKTVLLVSHNIRQVVRLCTRTILLDHGKVVADEHPLAVAELFYEQSNRKIQADQLTSGRRDPRIKSSGEVELLEIVLLNENAVAVEEIATGENLRIRVKLFAHERIENPEIVIGTHTTDFVYLTASSTALINDRPDFHPGEHYVDYELTTFPFTSGIYCIRLAIFSKEGRIILSGETLKSFSVVDYQESAHQASLRIVDLPASWKIDDKPYTSLENVTPKKTTSLKYIK